MESPDSNHESSASTYGKVTSFPVSSGLAFQQSCRPKASTALCNVRKISSLQRPPQQARPCKREIHNSCACGNERWRAETHKMKCMQAISPLLQDTQTEEAGRPCFRGRADSRCRRWRRGLGGLFLCNSTVHTQRQGLRQRKQGCQHEACMPGGSVRH